MSRDRVFLIEPGFEDPNRPGTRYFCPHCNQIEGVLASNPALAERIEVVRLPFPRPRGPVVALLGEENQGLPVLVLGDDAPIPDDAQRHGDQRFVSNTARILTLLAERHGAPFPH